MFNSYWLAGRGEWGAEGSQNFVSDVLGQNTFNSIRWRDYCTCQQGVGWGCQCHAAIGCWGTYADQTYGSIVRQSERWSVQAKGASHCLRCTSKCSPQASRPERQSESKSSVRRGNINASGWKDFASLSIRHQRSEIKNVQQSQGVPRKARPERDQYAAAACQFARSCTAAHRRAWWDCTMIQECREDQCLRHIQWCTALQRVSQS